MGGIGKSVLAACLVQEEEICRAFPDGVFWVVVGQTPNIEGLQADLAVQMGQPGCRFRQVVAGKACLLILDDVWDAGPAMAFRELGPGGCILLTTRDATLIKVLNAAEYCLDWLNDKQGLDLLAKWSGDPVETIAKDQTAAAVMREMWYVAPGNRRLRGHAARRKFLDVHPKGA